MHSTTRRALISATGLAAAGTLAAVTLLRKPSAPIIHTPVTPPEDSTRQLQPITALVPTDPPRPPASATFTDAAGNPHTLADFAGKGVVVNLWATWCAPCVAEMPALQTLARRAASDSILVIPLSSDRGGTPAVKDFFAAHGINDLPIWLDPKSQAAFAWGARGLPTTLIVDRQGRERARLEGAADWASDAALAELRRLTA
jgi:thiol-disulfide isomerase/thioredoxin